MKSFFVTRVCVGGRVGFIILLAVTCVIGVDKNIYLIIGLAVGVSEIMLGMCMIRYKETLKQLEKCIAVLKSIEKLPDEEKNLNIKR